MNHMFQGTRLLRAVGMTLVLALLVCVPAFAQQPGEVSGTVTSAAAGTPIQGVTVRVRGSGSNTVTDAQGKYSLAAPPDAVLVFSLIGYRGTAQSVGGRSTINLTLEQAISVLPDVVVTGYQEQLRRDLPTAASAVDVGSIDRQSGASALQGGEILVGHPVGVPGDLVDVGGEGGRDIHRLVLNPWPPLRSGEGERGEAKRPGEDRAPQLARRLSGLREHAVDDSRRKGGVAAARIAHRSIADVWSPLEWPRLSRPSSGVDPLRGCAPTRISIARNASVGPCGCTVTCRRAGAWH